MAPSVGYQTFMPLLSPSKELSATSTSSPVDSATEAEWTLLSAVQNALTPASLSALDHNAHANSSASYQLQTIQLQSAGLVASGVSLLAGAYFISCEQYVGTKLTNEGPKDGTWGTILTDLLVVVVGLFFLQKAAARVNEYDSPIERRVYRALVMTYELLEIVGFFSGVLLHLLGRFTHESNDFWWFMALGANNSAQVAVAFASVLYLAAPLLQTRVRLYAWTMFLAAMVAWEAKAILAAATLEWDNCVAFFLTAQPLILLAGLWGLWLAPHKRVMAINLLGWFVCLGCATAVTLVDKQSLPKNLLYNTVWNDNALMHTALLGMMSFLLGLTSGWCTTWPGEMGLKRMKRE